MSFSFAHAASLPAPTHTRTLLALAAATLAILPHAALAQGGAGPNKLGTVVVTATRSPMKLSEVLADFTVITREDIERQAFGGIGDLLRNAGCVEMVRNGGPALNTSLFLRGADTRHTVVLIDGVRVDSQASSGTSWLAIPISQVERVEVLKGPASAIYGSDAVGGVVQIITRKGGSKTQADLGLGFGSLGTRKADAGITGTAGIIDYALSGAVERSDGFNATLDLPGSFSYVPDRDGWRSHNVKFRVGAQLSAEHRLEAIALKSHADAQYDASKSKPLNDDHSIQDTEAKQLSWNAQWLPALQTQTSLGESSERYETQPSPYLTKTRIRNLALNGSYEFAKNRQLNFILERREDRLENTGLVASLHGEDQRHQNAAALGWLMSEGAFSLQAHARHDQDSQFGGVNTGTLALGWLLAPTLRVVGSAGTAFRAPSLYQRGSVYGPDLGKPGVKPLEAEHGRNIEFGLKYNEGQNEASITAYRNHVKDLIVFGTAGSCQSAFGCYANVSKARLQGVSLAAGTQLGPLRLSGTLDLQAPKDKSSNKLLARRAREHGTLRADTTLGAWALGAALQASGKRYDDAANTKPLAGYGLINLDAQYKLGKELRLQLNLDNAFNRAYQTAGGFAQAPRTLFVGLRYSPTL